MLIFLIGYMGCGKSTLGKGVARKLLMNFCDMDTLIEKQEMLSTAEIFNTKGEEYFRKLENETLNNFTISQNLVIATGGGAPCYYDNIDIMNSKGVTIYLNIKPGILASRLKNSRAQRPLIASKSEDELLQFIESTLEQRKIFYEKAQYIVSGDNIKVDDIINKIKE